MPQAEGQAFGKYQLLDRIAAGGMAEIYRAKYTGAAGVTKSVVVKKILPHYAGNKSFVSMFINEARIAVGLSHGNIAQVFDFGEIDGEYFLAMEFVDGQPLSRVLRRARDLQIAALPTPFAVFVGMETCKALHYAHTRLDEQGRPLNIIHRDVSPQNVIISYEGQVKIVDFGIAKARTAGRSETEAGAVKGKYVYFAPEQARGKELDARTDIFAAGICLFETLCGRLPFEGKMMEVLGKIVRCDFPRPRSLNPDITPALEKIILTAMAADREERYQTAQAFQEALAGYLYANAPTFSAQQLTHFMSYLYEKELVAEGRPVQLPKDFLEQAPLWRKKLPGLPDDRQPDRRTATASPKSKSRPSQVRNALEREGAYGPASTGNELPSLIGRLPTKWLFAGAPLVAMLIAALVVLAVGHFGSFAVQLTSTPAGAAVEVDGQPAPGLTPMLITNLAADRNHELRVSLLGMRPWIRVVSPSHGGTLFVNAPLEAEPPPEPRKPVVVAPPKPEPKVTTPLKPGDGELHELTFPLAGSIKVSTRAHTCLIPKTKAARMSLDPNKTYRLWTEGKLSLGGFVSAEWLDQVFYYLEGTSDLPVNESYGVLTPKPRTFKHAKALYAFVVDDTTYNNTGTIKVRVQERGERTSQALIVSAKDNAFEPDPSEKLTVHGLNTSRHYELTVHDGSPPARLREGRGGSATRVLYTQQAGWVQLAKKSSNDAERVLEVGVKYDITGTEEFELFFADDKKEDNDGILLLEVTEQVHTDPMDQLKHILMDAPGG